MRPLQNSCYSYFGKNAMTTKDILIRALNTHLKMLKTIIHPTLVQGYDHLSREQKPHCLELLLQSNQPWYSGCLPNDRL